MKTKIIFVTGIGTGVGKTIASAVLVEALQADYWKPVQSGDLHQLDADTVKSLISNPTSAFHPSRYLLSQPLSPHAAAEIDGVHLRAEDFIFPSTQNTLIIEGAGGLMVPLNEEEIILDIIPPTLPVVLVSRHYLGSINHTLLSLEFLKTRGYRKVAILFNGNENAATERVITQMSQAFILGRLDEGLLNKMFIRSMAEKIKQKLLEFLDD